MYDAWDLGKRVHRHDMPSMLKAWVIFLHKLIRVIHEPLLVNSFMNAVHSSRKKK
jgi:hypothetical protein